LETINLHRHCRCWGWGHGQDLIHSSLIEEIHTPLLRASPSVEAAICKLCQTYAELARSWGSGRVSRTLFPSNILSRLWVDFYGTEMDLWTTSECKYSLLSNGSSLY
jgi:hypothetical protein